MSFRIPTPRWHLSSVVKKCYANIPLRPGLMVSNPTKPIRMPSTVDDAQCLPIIRTSAHSEAISLVSTAGHRTPQKKKRMGRLPGVLVLPRPVCCRCGLSGADAVGQKKKTRRGFAEPADQTLLGSLGLAVAPDILPSREQLCQTQQIFPTRVPSEDSRQAGAARGDSGALAPASMSRPLDGRQPRRPARSGGRSGGSRGRQPCAAASRSEVRCDRDLNETDEEIVSVSM
jgi:hypothetical protein